MTLKASYAPGQTNVDFFARNAAGQWYNTSGTPAFENYSPSNLEEYRITATETPSGSGLYVGTEPALTTEFELRLRGATLAASLIVAGPAETVGESDADIIAELADIKAKTDLIGTIRSLIRW